MVIICGRWLSQSTLDMGNGTAAAGRSEWFPSGAPKSNALGSFLPSRTVSHGASPAAGTLPAVDVQDLSSNERRGVEKEDGVGDIACFTQPSDRIESAQCFLNFRPMHRRSYVAGRDGIFTRMPFFAYSIASDFVAALMPPFVNAARTV